MTLRLELFRRESARTCHPFLEETKHSVHQIRAKLCRWYGVTDADVWFAQERKRLRDRCAHDQFGILRFDSIAAFWESKQMEQKWKEEGSQRRGLHEPSAAHCVELYQVRGPGSNGEIGVLTTSHDPAQFLAGLSSALAEYLQKDATDVEHVVHWVLKNAMPIAFKLSGYKADQVVERHVLMCGSSAPASDDIIAAA